jgi:hypothetical protein
VKIFTPAFLAAMTGRDLRSLASDRQIVGRSAAKRKADLINLILEHQERENDIESEISPAMVPTADDESGQLPDGADMAPSGLHCPDPNTQVSLRRFYPPRPTPDLLRPYSYNRGSFPLV